ncbi:hypothetical protein RJ639_025726 [Escallonia herrerae]|uniref:Uncharacterized protein n=1 Tax=Escallonia herrerae TaxID=1293975 RepID=A0AA88SR46_9ASTE|nr:hypothetical protein RJ639_025726 [Escallonia herrerae]
MAQLYPSRKFFENPKTPRSEPTSPTFEQLLQVYESELAPENYKETAKQHPREVHVASEKHVLTSSIKHEVLQKNEEPSSPNKTITETVSEKLGPAYTAVSETVSEKLGPAYAAVSDATHHCFKDCWPDRCNP